EAEPAAADVGGGDVVAVARRQREADELSGALRTRGRRTSGERTVPRALARGVDEGVAHVQDERELEDTRDERDDQDRDEDELDDGGPAFVVVRGGPGAQTARTRWIAVLKTFVSAGPARSQIVTTSPAVMRVTRTQPGTSPRSGSSAARR